MDCPVEFYSNCRNAAIKCKSCQAGKSKEKVLFYDPIDSSLPVHPVTDSSDRRKRQQVLRQAKAVEQSVKDDIARGTIASGSVRGDGDLHLLKGNLRVEVKDRGDRGSWNLTWKEYEKGRRQGIDVYAISTVCPDQKRRTIYMLEEHTFNEWLSAVKQTLED